MLSVATIESQMKVGMTHPCKVTCFNSSKRYVLKCINESTNGKALFNELIASRLAQLIKLPTPHIEIGKLPQDVIDKNVFLKEIGAKSGACFLSEFQSGTSLRINDNNVKHIKNIDVVPKLVLFDALLMNSDRNKNDGNWFILKDQSLIALDHTNIFRVAQIWDKISLEQDLTIPPHIIDEIANGEYYQKLVSQYKLINSGKHHPFSPASRDFKKILNNNQLDSCFSDIPSDWKVDLNEITCAHDFVKNQIEHVNDLACELEKTFNFK